MKKQPQIGQQTDWEWTPQELKCRSFCQVLAMQLASDATIPCQNWLVNECDEALILRTNPNGSMGMCEVVDSRNVYCNWQNYCFILCFHCGEKTMVFETTKITINFVQHFGS